MRCVAATAGVTICLLALFWPKLRDLYVAILQSGFNQVRFAATENQRCSAFSFPLRCTHWLLPVCVPP